MVNIQDLSIGDWVALDGIPRKIFKLSADGLIKFYKLANLYGTGGIEPIPITFEILKANNLLDGEITMRDVNNVCTHIEASLGGLKIKKKDRVILNARVEYVHQLQHLLRLAGIDKEITI